MILIYFVLFILAIETGERIAKGKEQKINPTTIKYLIFSIVLYMFEIYVGLVFKIFE